MSRRTVRLATALALAAMALPAFAQSDPLAGGAVAMRALLGLMVVIGLILACAWVAKRSGFAARASAHMPVKLVGSMALGPRERVVMLQVEDTWLVVGVTPGGMQTLHTLPAGAVSQPAGGGWRDNLQRALARRKEETAPTRPAGPRSGS